MRTIDEEPLISVIMCVHNNRYSKELALAVESILNQTYRNLEFIICDDASALDVWECLLEYQKEDNRIILIQNKKNMGVASSLNRCLAKAKGEYIARMDGDDMAVPNRLEAQYDFLKEHTEYAFVGCNALLIEQKCIWGVRKMPEKPNKKDFLPYSPYIHPTVMGRRDFFLRDYGYRESRLTWRCEDMEFFMRRYSQKEYGYNLQENLYYYREDCKGYKRRKFRYCIAEALIRLQGYRRLHILLNGGWYYWLKPILVGILPKQTYRKIKRKYQKTTVIENNCWKDTA